MIKIKHINKYNKNKLENYNGEEIGLMYNFDNGNDNKTSSIFSYDNSDIFNSILESNLNVDENLKNELIGGAPRKQIKKDTKEHESLSKSNKLIHIKNIQKELLNDIIDNFGYIFRNNNIDDNKLLEIVHRLVKNKNYNLSNLDMEMILRFLRENLLVSVKNKIIYKHPLFETVKTDIYTNSLKSLIEGNNFINYKNKIIISKAISYEWDDLTSLVGFSNRFSFKDNIIHPLFFILYGLKFPGIEDLSIIEDYSTMVHELKNDDFDGNNLFLLILRIADPNYLQTNDPKFMSAVANENLRINISILLKEIAFSIRTGIFENKSSDLLMSCLSNIKNVNNAKFEEEKIIQNLLSVFSFKPTLIIKPKNNFMMNQQNPLMKMQESLYSVPEAVYNIEYPINDFQLFNENTTPVFSNTNLQNIVYDPVSKKVIFSYYNAEQDCKNVQEEFLKNVYNYVVPNQHEVNLNDITSTILTRGLTLDESFKTQEPVKVLLSNGIFIMSIPRETIRYSNNPTNNLFYVTKRKETINISPVLIEQNITINKVNYNLAGGLCYDILETSNTCPNFNMNFINQANKMGVFAIIKLSNGKWLEYNPNIFLTNSRLVSFINKALKNNYNNDKPIDEYGTSINYDTWLADNENEIFKNIIKNKISLIDMYISEQEALEKLSMYGNLIFYKEPYDYFRARCEEKYVF